MASTVNSNRESSSQTQPKQFVLKKNHFIITACVVAVAAAVVIVFAVFNRGNLERDILGDWMQIGTYNADGDFRENPTYLVFALCQ